MSEKAVKDMSFEEAMRELESVVAKLESGDVPLEDSIKLYERGAALKEHCQKKLSEAEEKVAQMAGDHIRILDECLRCGARRPAAFILQDLRQIPVIERNKRCNARFQQFIHQPAVEV